LRPAHIEKRFCKTFSVRLLPYEGRMIRWA